MKKINLLALGACLLVTNFINAQTVNWGTIDSEVATAKNSMIQIVGHVVGIILAIAFAFVLYKVATGKQDSKESLIGLGGGLAIYIIAMALGFL